MYIPILALPQEAGDLKEGNGARMFKHKHSFGQEQVMLEDKTRDFCKVLHFKRRISKYHMVLFPANAYKIEYIHSHRMNTLHAKIGGNFANKVDGPAVVIHKVNIPATA